MHVIWFQNRGIKKENKARLGQLLPSLQTMDHCYLIADHGFYHSNHRIRIWLFYH